MSDTDNIRVNYVYCRRGDKFMRVLIGLQIIFIILFSQLAEYGPGSNARPEVNAHNTSTNFPGNNELSHFYPMFQDVHVMIFVGFGFLMTFLKLYGFGSVSLNLLLAALVIQWATLMTGFLYLQDGMIQLSITTLLTSDFACAAVLISFGACLGKLSPLQVVVMAILEIVLYSLNKYIGMTYIKAADVGGSMFVHSFGAYFGIAVARVLYTDDVRKSHKQGSVYHSDIFAMIGTIFLWVFWPSFNSALATGDSQHRAVINTYFALASCTVVTFAISAFVHKADKIEMVHIQNATLAAGVAVGTSADMMIEPWGALCIGASAAIVSVLGYKYITPLMALEFRFYDTCGVYNLHGMPGVLGGLIGAIVAAAAKYDNYGNSLYEIFPARIPEKNTSAFSSLQREMGSGLEPGDGRSASTQAWYQILAVFATVGISIVGGVIVGFILKIPIYDQPRGEQIFDDKDYWQLPENIRDEKIDMSRIELSMINH